LTRDAQISDGTRLRRSSYPLPVRQKLGKTPPIARLAATFLLAATLIVTSGCGGSSESFSSGESRRALATLDSIETAVDDGRCQTAVRLVGRLAAQANHVNSDRPDLGEAWAGSVARLSSLVLRECVEISAAEPTAPVTVDTGPTEPVVKPKPEEQPVTPSTPEQPGDGGAGEQPGGGGGQGGGGNTTTPPDNSGGAGPGT
jgi:hypothetical protein